MRIAILIPVVCVSAALHACSGTAPTPPLVGPARLSLGAPDLTIGFAGTLALQPLVLSPAGDTLPLPAPVSFISRNPAIVAVDAAGRLTGTGPGQTYVAGTVAAADLQLSDSVKVTVICTDGQVIAVTPSGQTLAVGSRLVPSFHLTPCAAGRSVNPTLSWSTPDPAVLQVDPNSGEAVARRVGTTYLVARDAVLGPLTTGVIVTVR